MRLILCIALIGLLLGFAGSAPLAGAVEETAPRPEHLIAAEKIATEIDPSDNAYSYTDPFIKWKGYDGATRYQNRTDCSEFFNLLLRHSYRVSAERLREMTGHDRPTARVWFDAIKAGKTASLLEVVPKLTQAKAGDVLFVRYPEGSGDTGHVMVLATKPMAREASKPIVEGTRQWEVAVVDSSKDAHGPKDTRHKGEGKINQGVGRGTLRLYTSEDGTLAGYTWSTSEASKFEPVSKHALVLTRVKEGARQE
jgi:hypothetical protein